MRENKKHIIDWNNRNFLEIDNDWRRRKIKEALYIDSFNPQMEINPRKLMKPEKGKDIFDCWKENMKQANKNIRSPVSIWKR